MMKGLVLAGGSGSRLRPITHTGAKQLVPIANRPILFYVMDNLVDAGIRDIGVVVSPETGEEVKAHLGDGSRFGARFEFIQQDKPGGLAHAVRTARAFLKDSDFCMFLGDNLIGSKVKAQVRSFIEDRSYEAAIMLKEVPNPSAFGVAEVDQAGNVVKLVEKPKEPKSNLALVGIYLFRASIFDAISKIAPSWRGELEITDAISKLLDEKKKVRFSRVDSWWLDTGKKDDILLANETVLDAWLEPATMGTVCSKSTISGRVRIEEGAEVINSTLRGPIVIGRGAKVIDAKIGPFTSIGNDVTIERSIVEHSVILEGTSVRDIPRLEDSLIGRRVQVSPGKVGSGAISLLVGDDSHIEVSREKAT